MIIDEETSKNVISLLSFFFFFVFFCSLILCEVITGFKEYFLLSSMKKEFKKNKEKYIKDYLDRHTDFFNEVFIDGVDE